MVTNLRRAFGIRSLCAVLIGMALVMIPAGIIYSTSFLALSALFPAAGFNQSSHGLGAETWRILCCLGCAAVAGYFTQTFSRERLPLSLGILPGSATVFGAMGIPT